MQDSTAHDQVLPEFRPEDLKSAVAPCIKFNTGAIPAAEEESTAPKLEEVGSAIVVESKEGVIPSADEQLCQNVDDVIVGQSSNASSVKLGFDNVALLNAAATVDKEINGVSEADDDATRIGNDKMVKLAAPPSSQNSVPVMLEWQATWDDTAEQKSAVTEKEAIRGTELSVEELLAKEGNAVDHAGALAKDLSAGTLTDEPKISSQEENWQATWEDTTVQKGVVTDKEAISATESSTEEVRPKDGNTVDHSGASVEGVSASVLFAEPLLSADETRPQEGNTFDHSSTSVKDVSAGALPAEPLAVSQEESWQATTWDTKSAQEGAAIEKEVLPGIELSAEEVRQKEGSTVDHTDASVEVISAGALPAEPLVSSQEESWQATWDDTAEQVGAVTEQEVIPGGEPSAEEVRSKENNSVDHAGISEEGVSAGALPAEPPILSHEESWQATWDDTTAKEGVVTDKEATGSGELSAQEIRPKEGISVDHAGTSIEGVSTGALPVPAEPSIKAESSPSVIPEPPPEESSSPQLPTIEDSVDSVEDIASELVSTVIRRMRAIAEGPHPEGQQQERQLEPPASGETGQAGLELRDDKPSFNLAAPEQQQSEDDAKSEKPNKILKGGKDFDESVVKSEDQPGFPEHSEPRHFGSKIRSDEGITGPLKSHAVRPTEVKLRFSSLPSESETVIGVDAPTTPHTRQGDLLVIVPPGMKVDDSLYSCGPLGSCCSVPPLDVMNISSGAVGSESGDGHQAWASRGDRLDAVWKVIAKTWIRSEQRRGANRIYPLEVNDEITVTAIVREDLRVIAPCNGWVSLVAPSGEPLVMLAPHDSGPEEAYPTIDFGEALMAAISRDDVDGATVVATDLASSGLVALRHVYAVRDALEKGNAPWGSVCKIMEQAVWGSPKNTTASLQSAIVCGDMQKVVELAKSPDILAQLPVRHIGMVEVFLAMASQLGTGDEVIWESILQHATKSASGAGLSDRVWAIRSPLLTSLVVSSPLPAMSGTYVHAGECNGRPAYRLDAPGGRGEFLILWHSEGVWWFGSEAAPQPIFHALGGWLPPSDGWRGGTEHVLTGEGNAVSVRLDVRAVVEGRFREAFDAGKSKVVSAMAVEPRPTWVVAEVEQRIVSETLESDAQGWCATLRAFGLPEGDVARAWDNRRYARFPKLDARRGWQLLSLHRLLTLGDRHLDLLSDDSSLTEDTSSLFTFNSAGKLCITTGNLGAILQRLGRPMTMHESQKMQIRAAQSSDGTVEILWFLTLLACKCVDTEVEDDKALKVAFDALCRRSADRGNTQLVSPSELKQCMQRLQATLGKYRLGDFCLILTDEEVQEMMREADLDGDGSINEKEFVRIVKAVTKEQSL